MPSDASPNRLENPNEKVCSLYKLSPKRDALIPMTPFVNGSAKIADIWLNGLKEGIA